MRPLTRPTRLLALALAGAAVPAITLTGGQAAQAAPVAQTTQVAQVTASAATAAPEIPDSPAGRQLRWFLGAPDRAPLSGSELAEHIDAAFLAELTVERFNVFLADVRGLTLEKLTEVTPTALTGTGRIGDKAAEIRIRVNAQGKIDRFGVGDPQPPIPAAPKSWAELDARLRKVAPEVGFLAAEIDSRGRCRTVHGLAAGKVRPLGSIFKLYVLGAVAEKIRDGRLSWDTKLTIRPEWKSPSEGGLYERPDGSTVTVREAAELMISISDNTATDLLIHTVGRKAVEAKVRQWSDHPKGNVPFLTTKESFLLKGVDYPKHARAYLARDARGRRAYLEDVVAKLKLTDIKEWTAPREIHTLEWFGSPKDVCRAYSGLAKLSSQPLHKALSANDIGIGLDPAKWPAVWAKGGSELGVLDLSYAARTAAGKTYVVVPLANDRRRPLDEAKAAPELVSLSRGAFALLAEG
ncbi:serine hydrolase [Planomonospora algeriensis]